MIMIIIITTIIIIMIIVIMIITQTKQLQQQMLVCPPVLKALGPLASISATGLFMGDHWVSSLLDQPQREARCACRQKAHHPACRPSPPSPQHSPVEQDPHLLCVSCRSKCRPPSHFRRWARFLSQQPRWRLWKFSPGPLIKALIAVRPPAPPPQTHTPQQTHPFQPHTPPVVRQLQQQKLAVLRATSGTGLASFVNSCTGGSGSLPQAH